MKLNKDFYKQIFISDVMAEFLSQQDIEPESIRRAVLLAPVSLTKKREILEGLSQTPDGVAFEKDVAPLDRAICEMNLKESEILSLFIVWLDNEIDFISPCDSWDDVFSRVGGIESEAFDDPDDDDSCDSFIVQKWKTDGRRYKKVIEYMIAHSEVIGFNPSCIESAGDNLPMLSRYEDLNLPMPFSPGDIVLIDCTPFAPLQRVVILECGDNSYECCLPCALFNDHKEKVWRTGAIKHKHIFPKGFSSTLSPLYRIEYEPDPLYSESETTVKIMNAVSEYISGSEERAKELYDYICNLQELPKNRSIDGITEEQLWNYLNKNGLKE